MRRQELWATHLGPELGGQGYGQLKLSLLNEILGRSSWAPIVFGCQAPDTGNAEIIAHYGTDEQKERYLRPLLEGEIFSCYSMTEPHAGADPTMFTTRAVKDGDEWVINGWKFFSSNAKTASFLIVMAVTNPDVSAVQGHVDVPGPDRHAGRQHRAQRRPGRRARGRGLPRPHPLRRRAGARPTRCSAARARRSPSPRPASAAAASTTPCAPSAWPSSAFDMMCERALSRETQGSLLADKQFVQGYIADSYAQLTQFRLFVLYTAWSIDKHNDYRKVRKDIAAVKVVMPAVLHDIAWRAMQVHGALGVSNEMPFHRMMLGASVMGLADGPTEVHKVTVARQVLRDHAASDDLWPTQHLPKLRRGRPGQVRRAPRARSGEPVIDIDRLADAGWTARGLGRKGEPIEHALRLRRHPERDLRDPPRRPPRRAAHPARRRRPRPATTASSASGGSSRRSTAPTCPTPRPSPSATTRPCSAAPST